MKLLTVFLFLMLTVALPAQTTSSSSDLQLPSSATAPANPTAPRPSHVAPAPFSRLALGVGVSPLGINLQAAVNADRYINLRFTGNVFKYSVSNLSTNGFTVNGNLNLASAGASVDFYPFPYHGFRVSPGVLFYNQNGLSVAMTAQGGTSFTLNDSTYYSSASDPVAGNGSLGLNTQNPAFTITTGWGNMISRRNRRLSFPFEIGAAFIGSPVVNLALTSGQVCSNPQGTLNCTNVVGNSQLNSNLQAQIAKYNNDLNPLRYYPIISAGVAYNFSIRKSSSAR